MVVVTRDAGDGGFGVDGVDQAAQGPILGGSEVSLEGISGDRTRAADQADVDQAAMVTFDPGADLGFSPSGQDRPVVIDQVVVSGSALRIV